MEGASALGHPGRPALSGVEVELDRDGAIGRGGAGDHRLEGALQVQSCQAAGASVAHDLAVEYAGAGDRIPPWEVRPGPATLIPIHQRALLVLSLVVVLELVQDNMSHSVAGPDHQVLVRRADSVGPAVGHLQPLAKIRQLL